MGRPNPLKRGRPKNRKNQSNVSWRHEIGLVAAGNLILKLRGIFLLPVIAGSMGAAAFGMWVQVQAAAQLGATLASLNLRSAAVRLLISPDVEARATRFWSIFTTAIIASIIGGALLYFSAPQLGWFLTHDRDAERLFRISGFVVPLLALNELQIAALRGLRQVRTYATLNVIKSVGDTLATIIALLIARDLALALYALVAWRSLLCAYLIRNSLRLVPLARPRWSYAREALAYSLPASPAPLANSLIDKSDRFVIGYLLGASAVGIYSAAYAFSYLLLQLIQPIRLAMVPRLGAMWDEGNRAAAVEIVGRIWRYIMVVGIPMVIGLGLIGPPALELLTSPEMATEAGPLVGWLALGVLAFGATTIVNQVFFLEKKTKFISLIFGVGAALNLALNFWLIPEMGLAAAALSTIVAYVISFGIANLIAWRRMQLRLPYAAVGRIVAVALLMAAVLWWLPTDTTPRLALSIGVAAIVYMTGIWYSGALEEWERARISRAAGKALRWNR